MEATATRETAHEKATDWSHFSIEKMDEDELPALVEMNKQIFRPGDLVEAAALKGFDCYWIKVGIQPIGMFVLGPHQDHWTPFLGLSGSLYLRMLGIMPPYQGYYFGTKALHWIIEYARNHGFTSITGEYRISNERMARILRGFGFAPVNIIRGHFRNPLEGSTEDGMLVIKLLGNDH